MTTFRALALIAIIAGVAACGTKIDYVPLNSPPHAVRPRAPEKVDVFMSKAPERPFVEVATIESQQESGWSGDNAGDIIQKMREEAGQRGCDGLVFAGSNDATLVSGNRYGVSSATLKGYRATCIVYKDGV